MRARPETTRASRTRRPNPTPRVPRAHGLARPKRTTGQTSPNEIIGPLLSGLNRPQSHRKPPPRTTWERHLKQLPDNSARCGTGDEDRRRVGLGSAPGVGGGARNALRRPRDGTQATVPAGIRSVVILFLVMQARDGAPRPGSAPRRGRRFGVHHGSIDVTNWIDR